MFVTSTNDEGRLVKNLLENYSRVGGRWARGVTSNKDVLNVTHGLTINNVHIDLAQGVMTVTAWENLVKLGDLLGLNCFVKYSLKMGFTELNGCI